MDPLVVPIGTYSLTLTDSGLERHIPPSDVQYFPPNSLMVDVFTTFQMVTYASGWEKEGNGELLNKLCQDGFALRLIGEPVVDLEVLKNITIYMTSDATYQHALDEGNMWHVLEFDGNPERMSFFTYWCLGAVEEGQDIPEALKEAVSHLVPNSPDIDESPTVNEEVLEIVYNDLLTLVNAGYACLGYARPTT